MLERGDQLFTSAFAVGEILVNPWRPAGVKSRNVTSLFSVSPRLAVIPFELETSSRYAAIRGDRSVRPGDAIHLACAACAGIDLFITNDDRLSRRWLRALAFCARSTTLRCKNCVSLVWPLFRKGAAQAERSFQKISLAPSCRMRGSLAPLITPNVLGAGGRSTRQSRNSGD